MATQTSHDVVTKAQSVGESLPTDVSATSNFDSAAHAAPADSTLPNITSITTKPEATFAPVEHGLFPGSEGVKSQGSEVSC